MQGKILIVDDEKDMLALLKRIILEEQEYDITLESNPLKALESFKTSPFDLVITDLKMPQMSGIELLEAIKKIRPNVSVIILTAYATIETAVEAIRKGADDYITKPFRRERILLTIDKVMKWQELVKENQHLKQALEEKQSFASMVGSTPAIKNIFENIRRVGPTMATVLITGPSGTGKELVAKAIHQNSLRKAHPCITVNCTAIPEHVIESELFGHVKGSFTGAIKDKKGLVEVAEKGTLFLDEIGDLSPSLQTKLLRLLQESEYRKVGSEITKKADVRFIAATNHDLKEDIKEMRFREDLYYRLNVIHIDLPPLCERKKDIPLLCYHFLNKFKSLYHKDIQNISPTAMQKLLSEEFPGNVRELENIIERGVIYCQSDSLESKDFDIEKDKSAGLMKLEQDIFKMPFKDAKDRMIDLFHRQYVETILIESHGNISKAANLAGIQRQYLHRLMKEADIHAGDFKQEPGMKS